MGTEPHFQPIDRPARNFLPGCNSPLLSDYAAAFRLPRTPAFARPHRALDNAFDFILERVPAEDKTHPPRCPDFGDFLLRDRMTKQLTVGERPGFRCRAQSA